MQGDRFSGVIPDHRRPAAGEGSAVFVQRLRLAGRLALQGNGLVVGPVDAVGLAGRGALVENIEVINPIAA